MQCRLGIHVVEDGCPSFVELGKSLRDEAECKLLGDISVSLVEAMSVEQTFSFPQELSNTQKSMTTSW